MMTHTAHVHVQFDYVKGLLPVFTWGDEYSPFGIEEWPPIRTELREEILKDVPDEFEVYLNSDRMGERFEYTIGTIELDDEGEIVSKDYDTSLDGIKQAFEQME